MELQAGAAAAEPCHCNVGACLELPTASRLWVVLCRLDCPPIRVQDTGRVLCEGRTFQARLAAPCLASSAGQLCPWPAADTAVSAHPNSECMQCGVQGSGHNKKAAEQHCAGQALAFIAPQLGIRAPAAYAPPPGTTPGNGPSGSSADAQSAAGGGAGLVALLPPVHPAAKPAGRRVVEADEERMPPEQLREALRAALQREQRLLAQLAIIRKQADEALQGSTG